MTMMAGRFRGAAYTGGVGREAGFGGGGDAPCQGDMKATPGRAVRDEYAMNQAGTERRFVIPLVLLIWLGCGSPLNCHWPFLDHGPSAGCAFAADALPAANDRSADAGWDHLLHRAYLPADFDQQVFDELWTTWEQPLRSEAEGADVARRRKMAMDRYGLTPHPDDPSRSLQYVVDDAGRWSMSCLACHQGTVAGRTIPGAPNTLYALETLTEEVRQVKIRLQKPLGHMDLGGLLMPLGTTVGTTNAVMFGVALLRHRDADLAIIPKSPRFDLAHHDMDAPAWWHYHSRRRIYADAFAPKGHRMLMQFLMVKENGPERFREWEDEFRDIEAWIDALEPPPWEGPVNAARVAEGRELFVTHCGNCHGTYDGPRNGPGRSYPERVIAIDEIGTDRDRFDALTADQRKALNDSWFAADTDSISGIESPIGYVAPPLDGVWASAPYLHNGSVPTLWHLLHPEDRPRVWRRGPANAYDTERVGLAVEVRDAFPPGRLPAAERRTWFDTSRPGKGATGHTFPDVLDEAGKAAVLEYLKTL